MPFFPIVFFSYTSFQIRLIRRSCGGNVMRSLKGWERDGNVSIKCTLGKIVGEDRKNILANKILSRDSSSFVILIFNVTFLVCGLYLLFKVLQMFISPMFKDILGFQLWANGAVVLYQFSECWFGGGIENSLICKTFVVPIFFLLIHGNPVSWVWKFIWVLLRNSRWCIIGFLACVVNRVKKIS